MRSHYCGSLRAEHIDDRVTLCGWVDRRRDHGGVIFLDLRDREGIVQVVFHPDTGAHFETADRVRSEYLLQVTGVVRARTESTVNPNMGTAAIELAGATIEMSNAAHTPPYQLPSHPDVGANARPR